MHRHIGGTNYQAPYTEQDAPTLGGTNGAVLRHKRKRRPRLDQGDTRGYRALRDRLKQVDRAGDRVEEYRLLKLLREWEVNGPRIPTLALRLS